jgi:translocation and assembly module TamB
MADDEIIETGEDATVPARRRASWPLRLLKGAGIAVAALLALVALVVVLLDSGPGKRFIGNQVRGLEFENGMEIDIGRIEGSIYGVMTIHDVSLRDPKGEFLRAPELVVDWNPGAVLRSHVDIDTLVAERIVLARLPEFRETPPSDAPLLPDIDIDIDELRVERFIVEPAVTGQQRLATLDGEIHIASGRAQVQLDGKALDGPDGVGGDVLRLALDAVPEANRLAIDIQVDAPQDGIIASLGGLTEALALRVSGKGDWASWSGKMNAALGGAPLADLALLARNGTFAVTGPARISRLFTGPTANLLGPETRIDLAAELEERRANLNGSVSSDAFRLNTNGLVDLSDNSFEGLKLTFALLKPSALAENLSGRGLRGVLTLDGAFATPRVAYSLNAARLTMDDMGLVDFAAKGDARIDADRILVPVEARAARITGLDSVAGGSLSNVRLAGDVAIDGSRVLSDNMRVISDRIDARAILAADIERGFYTGAIDGRIDNYRVESVGIFNITTDVDLETDGSGFALAGKVRARSTRIDNDSVRDLLGGNAVASSNVRYGTDGVVRFSGLRLESPGLRILGGKGTYAQDGRINLTADAISRDYGKIGVRVAGTLTNPDARIVAENPNLGIGLANLDARISGAGNGYRLDLKGDTDYGPLTADVTLGTGATTTLAINSANLSGIAFTGTLRQTRAGPFSGQLRAKGNGLGGLVRLDAQGQYQEALVNLRANGTSLDGPAGVYLGSAIVDARIVLYDTPHVVADAQFSDTRAYGYTVNAGRVLVDYRDGSGQAKAVLEGTAGAPFRLSANATLRPDLWTAMLVGKTRGQTIRTTSPARIIPHGNSYELLPTKLELGGGTVKLAGKFGDALSLQSRFEGVDIGVVNSFTPGLGVGGQATGSIDFAQASANAFPRADARLTLANFTRTSSAMVSQPVNVNFVGKLLADGGEARAVFRRRGTVIGRMTASLRPLPPGAGAWTTRLLQAPLGGGIRYNGPAATLFSLAGQSDQTLSGALGVAADFSCRVQNPCLSGIVRGKGLVYENLSYGTRLTNMALEGRFDGNRLQIDKLDARAGNGTLDATGYISLASASGYPMDLAIGLQNARLARSDELSARATGQLRLAKSAGQTALLSGQLRVPESRYKIVREGAAEVPRLEGVRFKPSRRPIRITGTEAAQPVTSLFDLVRLDIALDIPERLYVSGMGLESEWSADLTVRGTNAAPQLVGQVNLIRGTLGFAGRSFELTEGQIGFAGTETFNPTVRIVATEDVDDVTVNVNVTGRAMNPQVAFTSVPGLPQDEIISRVLFGESIENLSPLQAVQLASSLNSLRGSGGGLNPLGKLRSATGIDRLRILGADEANGRGTAVAAGQYITNDIYVELITDARGFTATQLEVSITPWLSVLSQAGGSGLSNAQVRIKKNY